MIYDYLLLSSSGVQLVVGTWSSFLGGRDADHIIGEEGGNSILFV